MVVKGEVTAGTISNVSETVKAQINVRWDNIDTGVLHSIPSLLSDSLGGLFELLLGSLAVPVRLDNLWSQRSLFFESSTFLPIPDSKCLGWEWGKRHTFFMARPSPIRGKPRTADLTILIDVYMVL